MLDLRLPSGLFFALTGAVLLVASASGPQAPMTQANVDLYAGLAMLAFGAFLLALARRGRRGA